jgi:hypothetical protein
LFGKPEDKRAVDAGSNAAEYLAHNGELQKLLVANYESLAEGQKEILVAVRRLEHLQESDSKDIQKILQIVTEIEGERQPATPPAELPTWIDLSDYKKEMEVLQRERLLQRASSERERGAASVAALAFPDSGLKPPIEEIFASMVADEGKTYKVYNCRIKMTRWESVTKAYPTSGKYTTENGRLCREMVIDIAVDPSRPERRERRTARYCQTDGAWRQDTLLKREPYGGR